MIQNNQKNWDSALPYMLAAYRSSKHDVTSFTPNQLMFNREVHTPMDIVDGTPVDPPPKTCDDFADEFEH